MTNEEADNTEQAKEVLQVEPVKLYTLFMEPDYTTLKEVIMILNACQFALPEYIYQSLPHKVQASFIKG